MRYLTSALLASTVLTSNISIAQADINVVASIKPIHSLVSAVMDGVGTPFLIIDGAGSPHTYALKPSQAEQLQDADLIFWVGHDLETFLEKPIEGIATKATSIALIDAHDVTKIEFREGGAFDEHDHDDHDDHDNHSDDKDHDNHDDHDGFDPHVWLDPVNAKALVHEIEEALSEADPQNAKSYEENATNVMVQLDQLVEEITLELAPVKDKGYIVFHDAYQYFEVRFGVAAVGSLTVSPEVMPGARRVSELQSKVRSFNTTCVFSEPQFEPKLVATITENTNARTGILDPLGASVDSGKEHYFSLIRNMARSLKTCLSANG